MGLLPRSLSPRLITTIALRSMVGNLAATLLMIGMQAVPAAGQIEVGRGHVSPGMVFGTFGGENTNLPAYADNALGFDLGVAYQPRAMAGLEFRTTAYPFSATYLQMSFTGGYRVARQTIFGFPYTPFVYVGGGWARSQDKGLTRAGYPPEWEPCWQADLGFDRTYHSFSWRVAQASWRETYSPLNRLRSLGLSTGIVSLSVMTTRACCSGSGHGRSGSRHSSSVSHRR